MVLSPNFLFIVTNLFSIEINFCNRKVGGCLKLNLSQTLLGLAQVVLQLAKGHCYQDFSKDYVAQQLCCVFIIIVVIMHIFVSLVFFH